MPQEEKKKAEPTVAGYFVIILTKKDEKKEEKKDEKKEEKKDEKKS